MVRWYVLDESVVRVNQGHLGVNRIVGGFKGQYYQAVALHAQAGAGPVHRDLAAAFGPGQGVSLSAFSVVYVSDQDLPELPQVRLLHQVPVHDDTSHVIRVVVGRPRTVNFLTSELFAKILLQPDSPLVFNGKRRVCQPPS